MKKFTIQFVAMMLFIAISLGAPAADFPGSADHPLITRYPGSIIKWYDVQAYTEFKIPLGPVTAYRYIEEWLELQGKLTRIYYVLEGEKTVAEVYANYLKAVEKANFQVLAKNLLTESNNSKEVGGSSWMVTGYSDRLPSGAGIQLLAGSATRGGSCYIAAKLARPQGEVYLTLAGSQYSQNTVLFMLDVLESQAVEDDLVTVDAEAMSKDIDLYGKVALYGIYFDFDKATLKAESKPALDEIAALLKNRPNLELYVVGHTDIKGTLDYNITLSEQRAAAVVETLVKQYGVKSSRLTPKGVGPLVPVMTNQNDKGRAKNRRVELVEK